MKTTRYECLKDYFEIKCKKCGSTDVDLLAEYCYKCDDVDIEGECNKCKSKYSYHDFDEIEIECDNQGNEVDEDGNKRQ